MGSLRLVSLALVLTACTTPIRPDGGVGDAGRDAGPLPPSCSDGSVPADGGCESIDCGTLSPPTNGMVAVPTTTFGSVATYTCDTGYALMGSATRTCGPGGAWDGAEPTCASCPALPTPANATVMTNGDTIGSTATYTCNTGFAPRGSRVRRCSAGAVWLGDEPECRRTMPCACGGQFAVGDRVTAAVAMPSGAGMLAAASPGTVVAGSTGMLPLLVEWDGWPNGHDGNCPASSCPMCAPSGSSRWYVLCTDVAPQQLTCSCGSQFAAGERVAAAIDSPSGATGLAGGTTGTVIAAGGSPPLLVEWDGWTSGHDGNCAAATCGTCTPSGMSRWYVGCDEVVSLP
jgi:hypothetical protein